MSTKARGRSGQQGFTLVEVMFAMVIFAVGMLGLEALAIRAVQSVSLADRNSRSSATATHYLEAALDSLSREMVPANLDCTLANGDRVRRTVNLGNSRLPQVTVVVTPVSRGSTVLPITVNSYVYSSVPMVGSAASVTVCS